jgi:hypothetical protein
MYNVVMQSNGRNKLVPSHFEYEFCDDLWRHIKSFIKRPVYVERCLKLTRQRYYDLCNIDTDDIDTQLNIMRQIELYCISYRISNKDKRLTLLMNIIRMVISQGLPLDKDNIPIVKGLNRKLYKEIREKVIDDNKKSYYERANCECDYIINNAKPYKSETGMYVLFNGRFISRDMLESRQRHTGQSRQELIDEATKSIMSKILVASLPRYSAKGPRRCVIYKKGN